MSVAVVTVVGGTETLVGDGANRPVRCLVRFPDQTMRAAIVKYLSPQGVAAEVFCALLLRGWELRVPEPAVVVGAEIAFASLDTGYPNLKQRIGWSDNLPDPIKTLLRQEGARLVAGFTQTPRALSLDEAISNRDRNLGNILWDGSNVEWIDHERALGLEPDEDRNKLVDMVLFADPDYAKVQRAAVAVALTLSRDVITSAARECIDLDVAAFSTLVAERLGGLADHVLRRFPQPTDLFCQR